MDNSSMCKIRYFMEINVTIAHTHDCKTCSGDDLHTCTIIKMLLAINVHVIIFTFI